MRPSRLVCLYLGLSFAAQPKSAPNDLHCCLSDATTARESSLIPYTSPTLQNRSSRRRRGSKTASFGPRASHKERRRRQPRHKTMAEEKKSRACHYLQPQEWWFADATPIESVFLMMYGSRRPYAVDATRLHQMSHTGPPPRP